MVVAVREREARAEAAIVEGAIALVGARHQTVGLDVGPRGVEVTAVAAVPRSAEAYVVGRQRHNQRGVGGDAQTVRGGLSGAKRPTATEDRQKHNDEQK